MGYVTFFVTDPERTSILPGGRILVIDRDLEVHKTLERALDADGYRVEYTRHGDHALEIISASPPDAILVDLMMPGGKGRRFLSVLRDDMGITDIPVLVMTSIPGIDPSRAMVMGASDVIEKPINPEEVLNKLALALFRARGDQRTQSEEIALSQLREIEANTAAPGTMGFILVVDDDRTTLRHLDDLLTRYGYRVVSTPRATEEMIRLARVLEPQAIVVDHHLPGVDGLAAVRELRAESTLDPVPILILVDHFDKLNSGRAEVAGLAAEVMLKPLSDEELIGFVSDPPQTAWRSDNMIYR
ncbi:MAG: response regulator [Proteobacteria bacterium]|nr:response regulator [Pseudomonadota bacterium]